MTTHNDELKPCPFCGADLLEASPGSNYFHHPKNVCLLSGFEFDLDCYPNANIAAWNKRTPSNEPQPAARQAPARSATVDAGIQAMNSAFIDVTLHAQTAFKIVAYIKELERTLSSRSMHVVPEGWKMVPTVPTDEMINAAQEAYMPFGDMHIAIAMANHAAPTPPASNTEEGK